MTTDAEIVIGIKADTRGARVIKRNLDDIKSGSRQATSATREFEASTNSLEKAASGLGRTLGSLVATYAGAQGIRSLLRVSDTYTVIENKLKLVTDGTADLNNVQEELIAISDRTFTSLSDNATLFNRLTISTKEIGASQRDVIRSTEALQQTFRISGATAQEASNSTIQFAQGLASGALRGDEFRSVSENNIRLQKLLAEGLNVTTGELKEMADAGQLTAETIFPILAKSLETLNEEAEQISPTFEQAFNKVQEKLGQGIDEALRAEGHFQDLAEVIAGFSEPAENFGRSIGTVINSIVTLRSRLDDATKSYIRFIGEIAGDTSLADLLDGEQFSRVRFPDDLGQAPTFSGEDDLPGSAVDVFAAGVPRPRKRPEVPDEFFAEQNEKAVRAAAKAERDRQRELKTAADEARRAQESIDDVIESLEFETQQLGKNSVQQEINNNVRAAGVDLNSETGQRIADLTREYETQNEQLERQRAIADELSGAFDGFFTSALTGADGLKGALKGVVGSLADMALQLTVLEPLKQSLFNPAASSIAGSVSGGGGSIFSGISSLFGFNSGGDIVLGGRPGFDQNVLSLNGQPIANTGRGETLSISPAGSGNSGSGSGIVVNQTINVSTGVVDTVRSEILSFIPEIQRSTQAAITEAQLRGIA